MRYFLAVFLLAVANMAVAGWNAFETIDEARQRHSAERYNTYIERGGRAPLGGYKERLGDTAPPGTLTPGFNSYGGGLERYNQRGGSLPGTRYRSPY